MVNRVRVVVTDPIVQRLADQFRSHAPELDWQFAADLDEHVQTELLAGADVLVCAKLTAQQAAVCSAQYVHVTGTGTDRVALAQLPAQTLVSRTGHHERSIAEHIVMVTLAHQRRLFQTTRELCQGTWRTVATDPATPMSPTLNRLTFGFVGLGGIGTSALNMVAALGARAVAVRRSPWREVPAQLDWAGGMDELDELIGRSDVVVLGVPLNEQTTGLIGERELALMTEKTLLINVSRGPVIDYDALYEALRNKKLGGAALDVWWQAPEGTAAADATVKLARLENVIATPHNSGHTMDTFASRVAEITENIQCFAAGRVPSNSV